MVSYDGPEDAKQIFLNDMNKKTTWIAIDLDQDEEAILFATLKDYQDVFA